MRISKILTETRVLLLIGLVDLLLTLILFNVYVDLFGLEVAITVEENNIFQRVLAQSPVLFALLKTSSLLLCLLIIEFVRQKGLIEEKIAKRYLKIGIIAYLSLYAVLVIKTNILPLFQL